MKDLRISSRASDAQKVRQAVLPAVKARGYTADARFAIRLALDEAIANAIHHGNRDDASKSIHIEYEVDDDRVSISIRDDGSGFDPSKVPDPTLSENLQKPHGRGIMLMNAYMSRVSFNEQGNCVTMVKDRNCTRPR